MSEFKVGDRVVYAAVGKYANMPHGPLGTVTGGSENGSPQITWDSGYSAVHNRAYLRKVHSSLEERLEFAKTSASEQRKVFRQAESELDRWETRIAEIKRAIAERDKPRGRVKYGDCLPDNLYVLRANGSVSQHYRNQNTEDMVLQGNVFYDKESAQYEAEQRRQRVLGDK